MITQQEILLPDLGRGIHLITGHIEDHLHDLPNAGLLNILLKHTSAGLALNENADPSVRKDFDSFFRRLIPGGSNWFTHTLEGPDDMPAHLGSSLVGQSLTLPITRHRLNLGTWQGIYLCEFRRHGGRRKAVLTVFG